MDYTSMGIALVIMIFVISVGLILLAGLVFFIILYVFMKADNKDYKEENTQTSNKKSDIKTGWEKEKESEAIIKEYTKDKDIFKEVIMCYKNKVSLYTRIISTAGDFKKPYPYGYLNKTKKIQGYYMYVSAKQSNFYSFPKEYYSKSKLINDQVENLYNSWRECPFISEEILLDFCKKYNLGLIKDNMQNEENIICELIRNSGGFLLSEDTECLDGSKRLKSRGKAMILPGLYTLILNDDKIDEIGKILNKRMFEIGKDFYYRIRSSEALDAINGVNKYAIYSCDKTKCNGILFSNIGYKDLDSKTQQIGLIFALLERKQGLSEKDFISGLPLDKYEFNVSGDIIELENKGVSGAIYSRKCQIKEMQIKQGLKEWS